jgi:hypothetical protein
MPRLLYLAECVEYQSCELRPNGVLSEVRQEEHSKK